MDEILIEEKKYVSSKQAAKMTGYAKDYVGQLCREGRVPARLVGRSWYVLESAIADHRFGVEEAEVKPKVQDVTRPAASALSHWDAPRYESAKAEFLPYMSRREEISIEETEEEVVTEDATSLHDSWREWFDHIAEAAIPAEVAHREAESAVPTVEEGQMEKDSEIVDEEEVKIPLHFMSPRPEREPLPEIVRVQPKIERKETSRGNTKVIGRSIKTAGVLFALTSVVLAVVGSGYLDEYIISNSQAQVISGITVYNK